MDKKKAYLLCKYLHTEMKKINDEKWYEGERRKNDPGQEYIVDWINKNAADWRKSWDESKCSHCVKWKECGDKLRKECKDFQFDEKENIEGE